MFFVHWYHIRCKSEQSKEDLVETDHILYVGHNKEDGEEARGRNPILGKNDGGDDDDDDGGYVEVVDNEDIDEKNTNDNDE